MVTLTQNEKRALLILFKDFTNFYNANSISKLLDISHVGAQKIFKRLLELNLLINRKIGKSIIYKLKLEDDYVRKLIAFLLADEANSFKRWKEEFRELSEKAKIVILYGSVIKNYSKADDIDVMIVIDKKDVKEIDKIIKQKQEILPKSLHAIKLTHKDMIKNLNKKNKALIDIVKNGVVIYGQDKYVEIIKGVTGF
mgnify:FL=1